MRLIKEANEYRESLAGPEHGYIDRMVRADWWGAESRRMWGKMPPCLRRWIPDRLGV